MTSKNINLFVNLKQFRDTFTYFKLFHTNKKDLIISNCLKGNYLLLVLLFYFLKGIISFVCRIDQRLELLFNISPTNIFNFDFEIFFKIQSAIEKIKTDVIKMSKYV